MNDIEQILSNLPQLRHLELIAKCNNDVVNGERWQMILKSVITFKFMFDLSADLQSEDIDSFRTAFWLGEKCWYVGGNKRSLFSVPDFIDKKVCNDFLPPVYSTVSDDTIFYDCINSFELTGMPNHISNSHPNVQTLVISCLISPSTIISLINFEKIQHLIINVAEEDFSYSSFIDRMPNLRKISITYNIKDFLEQVHQKMVEKVQILEIGNRYEESENYNMDELSNVFSNIKHLHINHVCSTTQIFDFLDRFKRLSNASFCYVPSSNHSNDVPEYRCKIQAELDQIRRCRSLDYTYRFDTSFVHVWLS